MAKLNKERLEILLKLEEESGEQMSRNTIQKITGCTDSMARDYRAVMANRDLMLKDEDIIQQNLKLAKQRQAQMDNNRIERKSFRSHAREENALKALNQAVIDNFNKVNFNIPSVISKIQFIKDNAAIVQLSDTHFNELVDLENNKYDFEVASKRLYMYAVEIKTILHAYGIEKIVLAMTGDMINSDRRLDEKLNMATNRTLASMLAVNLLQYFINDLAADFKTIDVIYVTGNESRVEEFGFTDLVVTDNYDTIIFNMLRMLYRDSERINFIDCSPVEAVLNINGRNILIMHGTTIGKDTQGGIQKIIGKYSAKGTVINYVLFGHIHFANVTDLYARSGSLTGNNTYSDYGLNLITKASQNLTIIKNNGTLHCAKIELDDVEGVEGYPIRKDMDVYNAKSASKMHQKTKIIEIII